jgi:Leucine-rich repeat (LRR) protein
MSYNQISSLHKDIFRNSTNLTFLFLDSNSLQTLDATSFLNNPTLIYISLNGNKINALSSKMFQPFYNTSLTLDLRNNTCIDQYFGSFFLLNATQQQFLESALETCDKNILVKVLNCTEITSLPNTCSFDNQVLGTNDTANFTVSSGLTPATVYYINFNSYVANSVSFYYIPASLFTYFPNVYYMYLYYGNIQEIRSNTFLNATNLQYIYLTHNNISALGADIFRGAQNLFYLHLGYNQLSSIDANAFRGLSKLNYLYLNNNKITTLNSQTFAPLNSLGNLSLSNNQISSLDKDSFTNLANLVYLYMDFNLLESLDAIFLVKNTKLEFFSLHGNKINTLSRKMFQPFYNTSLSLDLRNNVCINQSFGSGFLLNEMQQRSLENALETCDKICVPTNSGNSTQLLLDLANLLNNFFVAMSKSILNVNGVLTNYSAKVSNFTRYI